jgi:Family of unknown function (DUF6502)
MPDPTTAPRPPDAAAAAQALASVLQPVARLMIEHGLQIAEAVELLKSALVRESVQGYGLPDKQVSDTRVALLTGVHRKDVRRLRQADQARGAARPARAMVSLASAVVARWISDPRYLQLDQNARALARTSRMSRPGEPDFATLVAEVSRDTSARSVLDELLRLGTVRLRADACVELVSQAFVPQGSAAEQFHFLAAGVGDHLSACVRNVSPGGSQAPLLDQSAFSADLSATQAELLHQQARQLWSGVLKKFLQSASIAEQRSAGHAGPRHRVRFGVYFHEDTHAAPAPAPGSTHQHMKKGPPHA